MDNMKLKLFSWWLVMAAVVGFKPILVFAQNESQANNFEISLNATYTVEETGRTKVDQNFTITNKSPVYFIKEYAIIVGSNQLENISAHQASQEIPANVVTSGNQTSISLNFPTESVGQGKKRQFTLSYTSPDTAQISGKVLELAVPRLAENTTFSSYRVTVRTPLAFGAPTQSTPLYTNWTLDGSQIVTTFEGLNKTGVFLFFGDKQYYDLSLRYHLENPTGGKGLVQIALPPDTTYQQAQVININPMPLDIKADPDGNWIGTYLLRAGEKLSVDLTAQVMLSLTPIKTFPSPPPTEALLRNQDFWPSTDKQITQATQQISSAREVYDYVVSTLDYDYTKVGEANQRLGGGASLDNPSFASCQEFTDLFVTLARAKSIPSRRLTGYAYSRNQVLRPLSLEGDVLHAWPEFYDQEKQVWRAVDPTWEDTTGGVNFFDQFDLSHIVFAINGYDSSRPYPAGAYKLENGNTKDVEVKFASKISSPQAKVGLSLEAQKTMGQEINGRYLLKVTNQTGYAWYNLAVEVKTDQSSVGYGPPTVQALLPYQTVEIPLWVTTEQLLAITPDTARIKINDQTHEQAVYAGSQVTRHLSNQALTLGLGLGVVITTLITGSVLVYRRKRQSALRRQSQKSQKKSRQLPAAQTTAAKNP